MSGPFKSLRLYNYYNSSASWRIRLVLDWKNLKYEYVPINLMKNGGDHLKPEYSKINPMRQIPTLEIDGKTRLVESVAISQFLEELVPEPALLPKDPYKKADIIAFCEMINSGIHPKIVLGVQRKIEELGQDKPAWLKYWMNRGYGSLDEYLKTRRGKYCFGDNITLADMFFLPMTEAGVTRFGLDIDKFPISQEILHNLRQVEKFKKTYPKNQPDYE